MAEFPVDASNILGNINDDFGGNLNIRFSTGYKPLISFGYG
jgi:hypothetical protein